MQKYSKIILIATLVVAAFLGYWSGKNISEIPNANHKTSDTVMETPTKSDDIIEKIQEEKSLQTDEDQLEDKGTAEDVQKTSDIQEDEIVYTYDMSVDEIRNYICGKAFQRGSYSVAAGLGEIMYFTPQGNEYYWFCSSMDAQSRIRAEYGTWELEDGFITTKTLKMVEWIDGHFTAPFGSTGSRYELEDYKTVLTEVNIESWHNFNLFKFQMYDSQEEMGFYFTGEEYYYFPYISDMNSLKEEYGGYFSLFEK